MGHASLAYLLILALESGIAGGNGLSSLHFLSEEATATGGREGGDGRAMVAVFGHRAAS